MDKVRKFFTVLQLLIGLDWAVLDQLEEIEKRLYAVEETARMNRASCNKLNLEISKISKERKR